MQYVTMKNVAEMLSVSLSTVRRLVDSGELRTLKVRRSVRIPEESLKAYVERNTTGEEDDLGVINDNADETDEATKRRLNQEVRAFERELRLLRGEY